MDVLVTNKEKNYKVSLQWFRSNQKRNYIVSTTTSELHLNICQSFMKLKFIDIEANSFYCEIVSMKSEKNTRHNITARVDRKTSLGRQS